jgi:purine-nucleoside phosphorylase
LKRYFDAIIIVPLEEEFTEVVESFRYEEDLSTSTQIRFSVSLPDQKTKFLIAKQSAMGRTANQEAASLCVTEFDCGALIYVGIAGGLSSDVAIGDVCYSVTIIDVLDNGKIIDSTSSSQELAFSPITYSSPSELTIPMTLVDCT